MKAEILATKTEGNAKCYLIKASIKEYVDDLNDDFFNFHIQRESTSNIYLDSLPETIVHKRHIPTIVLVVDGDEVNIRGPIIRVSNYRILDGLQRTLRLKAFCDALSLITKNRRTLIDPALEIKRANLIKEYGGDLAEIEVDANLFIKILQYVRDLGLESLQESTEAEQWFELWVGLDEEAQVKKMLVLNAGHKPVKTRHQLELLFLSVLPKLSKGKGRQFSIVREKQASSTSFSKKRERGQFHFASVIAALIAYFSGKPITTNANLISQIQDEGSEDSIRSRVTEFTFKFSIDLTSFLLKLEDVLEDTGEIGAQWLGREVTLVGIFAALGSAQKKQESSHDAVFKQFLKQAQRVEFNLKQFEVVRNRQDLSRVNIGNANKNAIYRAMRDVLEGKAGSKIDWLRYFKES